ncbi:MAG: VWA domain-containing protein [Candidatus Saccharimonadales bacterium]|jgi:Ca-activated chloride channel family protein
MKLQPILPLWLTIPLILMILIMTIVLTLKSERRSAQSRKALISLMVVFMLIGISLPGAKAKTSSTNIDVYFVIDITPSMAAEDYNGNQTRLTGVSEDIHAFTEQLAGSYFSVISFGASSYVDLPLTSDSSAIYSVADSLNPEAIYYSNGSSISQPVELLDSILSNNKKSRPDKHNILIYMGDGEQTSKDKIKSFDNLKKYINDGLVLGYGTESGGKMKEYIGFYGEEEEQDTSYIKDFSSSESRDAVSKLNPENLKIIAEQLGVPYQQRSGGSTLKSINNINTLTESANKKDVPVYHNTYWAWAAIATVLLIIEYFILVKKLSLEKLPKPNQDTSL